MMNGDLISRSALHRLVSLDAEYGTYGEFMDSSEVSYTSREVHNMINKTPAVDAATKWISVKDSLPEDMLADKDTKVIHCLVALDPPRSQPKRKPLVTKAQRQWNSWTNLWEWGRVSGVTHWMPLPEPPKEE